MGIHTDMVLLGSCLYTLRQLAFCTCQGAIDVESLCYNEPLPCQAVAYYVQCASGSSCMLSTLQPYRHSRSTLLTADMDEHSLFSAHLTASQA